MIFDAKSGDFAFRFRWLAVALMLLTFPLKVESASPASSEKKFPLISREAFKQIGTVAVSLEDLGSIIDNPEKRVEFGTGEIVYISIGTDQAVKVGERFSIVNTDRVVYPSKEPVTLWKNESWAGYVDLIKNIIPYLKKKPGIIVRNVGTLEVVERGKDFSRAVIRESFDSIKIGDRLIAYQEPVVPELNRDYTPSPKNIQARILAFKERVVTAAREDIVYIDKGKAEEVRVGDRFEIFSIDQVDKKKKNWYDFNREKIQMPQVIGQLQILAVQKETATAVVRDSAREIFVGQRIRYVPRLLNPR